MKRGMHMTKIEAFKVLNLIEKIYPLVILKSETILIWMAKSESMDYSKVLSKLAVHMRHSPYPPTLNNLIGQSGNECTYFLWLEEYSIRAKKTNDLVAKSKNF
jgi:hypothetical protein